MQYIEENEIIKEHNGIGKIIGLALILLVMNSWLIGWKSIILYFFEIISLFGGYMSNEILKEMSDKSKLLFKIEVIYFLSIIIFIVSIIINLFMII